MALGHVNNMNSSVNEITDELIDIWFFLKVDMVSTVSDDELDLLCKSTMSSMFAIANTLNGMNEYKKEWTFFSIDLFLI